MSAKLSYFISVLDKLHQFYDQIDEMTLEAYDEKIVVESMMVSSELLNLSSYQKKEALIVMYNILATNAGTQFLKTNRSFCLVAVDKAKEILMTIGESTTDVDVELAKVLALFTITNECIFLEHGIKSDLFFGF